MTKLKIKPLPIIILTLAAIGGIAFGVQNHLDKSKPAEQANEPVIEQVEAPQESALERASKAVSAAVKKAEVQPQAPEPVAEPEPVRDASSDRGMRFLLGEGK